MSGFIFGKFGCLIGGKVEFLIGGKLDGAR